MEVLKDIAPQYEMKDIPAAPHGEDVILKCGEFFDKSLKDFDAKVKK